jgi:hypothetical protein
MSVTTSVNIGFFFAKKSGFYFALEMDLATMNGIRPTAMGWWVTSRTPRTLSMRTWLFFESDLESVKSVSGSEQLEFWRNIQKREIMAIIFVFCVFEKASPRKLLQKSFSSAKLRLIQEFESYSRKKSNIRGNVCLLRKKCSNS